MTLKKCTCGKIQTTRNAKLIGKDPEFGSLYFNCQSCQSTFLLMSKKTFEILKQAKIKAAQIS